MRPRPPRSPEREEIITLDIDSKAKAKGSALRILLLEDRDDFREILQEYLVSGSYRVTAVRSGVQGLRYIMKNAFDLIICDMLMPKMGGEMFYWAVSRVRPAACQRFLFFTGHKNNPAIEFFFRRVSATVLYKPFKLSELDAAISAIFRKLG
jgi:CheY-like chemotaxis protein